MSETILLDRDGLSVTLESGTSVSLRLAFVNESDDPGAFTGRLTGPGAPYAALEQNRVALAGGGRGSILVAFAAKEVGLFELGIEAMDGDGYVVEPPGRRSVTMVVKPSSIPAMEEPPPIRSTPAESLEPASVVKAPEPIATVPPPVETAPVEPAKPKPAPPKPKIEAAPLPPVKTPPPPTMVPEPAPPVATVPEPLAPAAVPVEPPPRIEPVPVVVAPVEAPPKPVVEPPKPVVEPPKARVVVEMPKEEPKPEPPKPKAEPTVVSFKRETKAPDPVPEPEVVPEPTPVSEPPKPKVERPRTVVEMGAAPSATAPSNPQRVIAREKPYDPKAYGKVLRNPKTGDVLELAPGGRALVLLDFENRGKDDATYVLTVKDDLRPTEDFAYARTLLEQINIRKDGTDELAFEVVIPENAPPQTLRIRATYGRREGNRELEISRITLKVTPRIAVKLSSPKAKVVVGPLNRVPEMALQVGNEGNVETAYRLTIKNPSDVAAEAKPGEYPDLESRDAWRYLFDKEAEDLRLDGSVPARLRFLRTGIWWLGWWETQKVKAVAVPVTDPRNAGRDGNVVDLVATRWRLLPMPWPLAVPLLLAFFAVFLGGYGVSDVKVDNAIRAKASGILFVLQDKPDELKIGDDKPPVTMRANLSWKAPFLSFLKIVPSHEGSTIKKTGSKSATAERTLTEYYDDDLFTVTSILGLGGASTERVVYLPMRTTGKFVPQPQYAAAHGGGFGAQTNAEYTDGAEPPLYGFTLNAVPQKIEGRNFNVTEMRFKVHPQDKVYISPKNTDPGKKIHVWLLEAPQSYTLYGIRPKEYNEVQYKSDASQWQLLPKDGKTGDDDLWLLTTDSRMSILHVRIQRVGGGQ